MRLYTIKPLAVSEEMKNWGRAFKITFNEHSIPDSGELDRWTRFNIRGHYYLSQHMMVHIGGGSTNNETYRPHREPWDIYYLLYCGNDDADVFLRSWTIPPHEYQRNLDWVQERDNMRQGWIKIDGVNIGYTELVKLWKANQALPKKKRLSHPR